MTKEKLAEILAAHALWVAMKGGSRANLRGANLSRANLRGANLRGADLSSADLSSADLSRADLSSANLHGANLSRADLSRADLSSANLHGADLSSANLHGANLSRADLSEHEKAKLLTCPQTGSFEGWKICKNSVLVRLLVPATAKRSSATGRKCRAEFVKVLEVIGGKVGISNHDGTTEYRKGKTVRCDKWEENRWIECGGGIHFFITRQEAENYQ